MKFSIIIPAYNAAGTIGECLGSIASSGYPDFETIVVDDCSTDATARIASDFPCRIIRLEKNRGTAHARNEGARSAMGAVLVFIDADVRVANDTLTKINADFNRDPALAAVTGLLAKECPFDNFFSQYKNLYMHFIFRRCPTRVDFLYGSLIATRCEHFLAFDERIRFTDDTELGQRFKELGKEILLDRDLKVVHIKKYSWPGIVRNDFLVPFWWTKSFLLHKGYRDICRQRRFSHARPDQLLSIAVVYLLTIEILTVAFTGFGLVIPSALGALFLTLNFQLSRFMHKERGVMFCMRSVVFTFIDQIIMGAGIMGGFIFFVFLEKPLNKLREKGWNEK